MDDDIIDIVEVDTRPVKGYRYDEHGPMLIPIVDPYSHFCLRCEVRIEADDKRHFENLMRLHEGHDD